MQSNRIRIWKYFHSAFAVLISALILFDAVQMNDPALRLLVIVFYSDLLVLLILGGTQVFYWANFVSLIRAFGSLPLLLLPLDFTGESLLIFLFLVFLEMSDLADGYIARKLGGSNFGAILDEETDALFTFILAFLLYRELQFGKWILSFGMIRYIFVLLFFLIGKRESYPSSFQWFSKTVCALAVSALIGGFALFIPHPVRLFSIGAALLLLSISFLWETLLNLQSGPLAQMLGLLHSIFIYYLIPNKQRRMKRFYSQFLQKGGLAFDIGSHVGNRIAAWTRLGAMVVAAEPNPACIRIIKFLHGRQPDLVLVEAAVGDVPGRKMLHRDPAHPSLNTLSEEWMRQVKRTEVFNAVEWKDQVETEVLTLDSLIAAHGTPDFCKIDVEGYELQVLQGLSVALKALSFEYLPSAKAMAERCLDRLLELGRYEFNLSRRETMRFLWPEWRGHREVRRFVRNLEIHDSAGDVYARLVETDTNE